VQRNVPAEQRHKWRAALRAVGLKCTEQRLAVLAELETARAPLTHREMSERLAAFAWDQATTFRNLNDLWESGLVTRIDAGDHVWRFELRHAHGEQSDQHAHFLCITCGEITCLAELPAREAIPAQAAGIGQVREVLLKGYCSVCEPALDAADGAGLRD
jgi:Fur family transcriptional regulator, ferric uptake regulator